MGTPQVPAAPTPPPMPPRIQKQSSPPSISEPEPIRQPPAVQQPMAIPQPAARAFPSRPQPTGPQYPVAPQPTGPQYPVAPQPTGPQYPVGSPHPTAPQQPAAARPNDTIVTRLVESGVRGQLIRQPWFQNLRASNADLAVYVSFGVGVVLTGIFSLIPSGFVSDFLIVGLWAGLAYLYLALGTKLSHQFLLWGICVAGGVVTVLKVLSGFSTLTFGTWFGLYRDPLVVVFLDMLLNVAVALALGYLGMQMHREIAKLSRP
ncbi:hypothetical protein [Mycolicibacterium fallax]|nr:hypothetical protein [Mycolicibacterium fallax]